MNIGTVITAGNPNRDNEYTFTDPSVLAGTYYYRIIQRDIDGCFSYSSIRTIRHNSGTTWKNQLSAGTNTIDLDNFTSGVYLLKAGDQVEQIIVL